jgi:hypothetical protein
MEMENEIKAEEKKNKNIFSTASKNAAQCGVETRQL